MSGWAVDGKAESLAGGVDVAIDGSPFYKAEYGVDQQDVAKALRVPGYAKSGFSFVLHAARFPKGKHAISIRVIAADKKSFTEGFPLTVMIE